MKLCKLKLSTDLHPFFPSSLVKGNYCTYYYQVLPPLPWYVCIICIHSGYSIREGRWIKHSAVNRTSWSILVSLVIVLLSAEMSLAEGALLLGYCIIQIEEQESHLYRSQNLYEVIFQYLLRVMYFKCK